MKVLHLVKTSLGAGFALRQMRQLVKLGIDVHVAIPEKGYRQNEYIDSGITVHVVNTNWPLNKPHTILNTINTFKKLVKYISPNIIHSHFVTNTITMRISLGRKSKIPRIFQVPGPLHLEHNLYRKFEISISDPNDYWIGCCKWTVEKYKNEKILDEKLFLAYYGLDLDTFYPNDKEVLRKNYNIDNDSIIVGMIAYMYPPKYYLLQTNGIKGHEYFIKAIKRCLEINNKIIGIIIGGSKFGGSNYEKRLKKLAYNLCKEKIIFTGIRDDIPNIYNDINIAVHPSLSENLGGAGQSLLLGVPTITTNVGGFTDIVEPYKTGWIVPPKDSIALANTILKVINSKHIALNYATNGKNLCTELLDSHKNAIRINNIYKKILNTN